MELKSQTPATQGGYSKYKAERSVIPLLYFNVRIMWFTLFFFFTTDYFGKAICMMCLEQWLTLPALQKYLYLWKQAEQTITKVRQTLKMPLNLCSDTHNLLSGGSCIPLGTSFPPTPREPQSLPPREYTDRITRRSSLGLADTWSQWRWSEI